MNALWLALYLGSGVLGSIITHRVRSQQFGPAWGLVSGLVSTSIWMAQARWGSWPLAIIGAVGDATYTMAWFATLLYMGHKINLIQGIGIGVVSTGLLILGLGGQR